MQHGTSRGDNSTKRETTGILINHCTILGVMPSVISAHLSYRMFPKAVVLYRFPPLRIEWMQKFTGFAANSKSSQSLHQQKSAFFPTCQVRVVRFYVSLLLLLFFFLFLFLLLLLLLRRRAVSPKAPTAMSSVSPQPRAAMSSDPRRTSSATICAQCSLPDLNRDHSAQCSLPDLNREIECQKVCQK